MTTPTMTEGDSACKTSNLSGLIARLGSFCCLEHKWIEWSVICHLNVAVTVIFNTQTTGSLLLFSKRMGCWDKEKWMHLTYLPISLNLPTLPKPCGLKQIRGPVIYTLKNNKTVILCIVFIFFFLQFGFVCCVCLS